MGDTIMAYGTLLTDTIQSSVASTAGTLGTPPQFNDANGVQTGTLCRAWVNFNGTLTGTNPPRAGFNVSSVTRNGTGDYTVNFTNAMPDANYAYNASSSNYNGNLGVITQLWNTSAPTTNSIRFGTFNNTPGAADGISVCIAIFR